MFAYIQYQPSDPPVSRHARPATLDEAIGLLAEGWQVLAGGTDLYPATQAQSLPGAMVDVTALPDLQGIVQTATGLRIGAAVTWSDLAAAGLPPACRALQQAARQVGGWQIQNAGTLGGNLCNASPAADGAVPLLVLGAWVELAGPQGTRRMPLADFLQGPRRTALRLGEVLVALHLPAKALAGTSSFAKLGARAHLVISVVMAAVRVQMMAGQISDVALAVGACAPTARRIAALEPALIGLSPEAALEQITAQTLAPHLAPIDDIRADRGYRLEAAAELLRRSLTEAAAWQG